MQDFEKLGVFYLGKEYDTKNKQINEDMVLLKSKDLITHAVIIGMTGSGKTGLGISLIEEAMIDNIPVIAIDPKGDLTNLALTFPKLEAEDFKPWINMQEATNKGLSSDEYAQNQADLWKKGLGEWGQDETRIENLRKQSDVKIYTPGGTSGIGVSVLKSFNAPSKAVLDDKETYKNKISVTTISILSLIGIEADIFTSREYIIISNIIDYYWSLGKDISLAELINAIQKPPIDKVGVMDLESFYPSKDRFSLAMMINNLIASPGFESWLEGESMDVNKFMYNQNGKPQVSVFSVAHLSDSERMFFVTMLLNEVLSWVRSQPGTGSLRAILYMDELFGYLPPTANPPSKGPLLTLLKQARAFGLGLVLSTQNPVDLDYKALSNAGTWFIGRLQTQRDKERVLAGLEGAAAGGSYDKEKTEQILAGLGQRVFYLHSVHEDEPVIFTTRWALSYLAGPLTREQISALPSQYIRSNENENEVQNTQSNLNISIENISKTTINNISDNISKTAPVLDPKIKQVFLPLKNNNENNICYRPAIIANAEVLYTSSKHGVTATKTYTLITHINDGVMPVDWNQSKLLDIELGELEAYPVEGTNFEEYPSAIANVKNYDTWQKSLSQHIRTNMSLNLKSCPSLKLVSNYEEDERDFKIRLQHLAHEKRDEDIESMRKKYITKIQTLENKQQKAMQTIEKQNAMASQKKMDAIVNAGSAILGAFFGRKSVSASRIGTAVKSTSRAMNSGQNIEQAQQTLESVQIQLEELQLELQNQLDLISSNYDSMTDKIEEIEIRAVSTNINIHFVGLAWIPHK